LQSALIGFSFLHLPIKVALCSFDTAYNVLFCGKYIGIFVYSEHRVCGKSLTLFYRLVSVFKYGYIAFEQAEISYHFKTKSNISENFPAPVSDAFMSRTKQKLHSLHEFYNNEQSYW